MIRFACPGCSATFTVEDEKAGKTGKCPKCQSQFVIPAAEAGPPPLPAAAPPPPDGNLQADPAVAVEIDPCPKCRTRLSVKAVDLGTDVECPYCQTVFKAAKGGGKPPAPPSAPSRKSALGTADERKSRSRRVDDDDDDDRPRNRRRRDEDDDDDYEEKRPSRRRRRRQREESKKVMAGVLAIVFGVFFGIPVHKFVLGYTGTGILQLVLNWVTCGTFGIVQIVEGIIYLTKTDEEFIETYQVGQKEWF
jgi:TM2 domain-containing membrane protein YozV